MMIVVGVALIREAPAASASSRVVRTASTWAYTSLPAALIAVEGLAKFLDLRQAEIDFVQQQHDGLDVLVVLGLFQPFDDVLERGGIDRPRTAGIPRLAASPRAAVERKDGDDRLRLVLFLPSALAAGTAIRHTAKISTGYFQNRAMTNPPSKK